MAQTAKVLAKKKKFFSVNIPLINSEIELAGNTIEELNNRTIKLDLTRQLRGKSVEAVLKIKTEKNSAVAYPIKMVLMPYFIRRMIRKRISYVEDSFTAPTQESLVKIKPFLITRNKVSRAVRKTLRNLTKNWIEDYLAERKDEEIFDDLLTNRLQKPLSLKLKKTYPLSLCEIRILEIIRPLQQSEVPKIVKSDSESQKNEGIETSKKQKLKIEEGLDQFAEIEEEKIRKAEKEIKETQEKASKADSEGKLKPEETEGVLGKEVIKEIEKTEEKIEKKPRKPRKTKEKKEAKEE
jgi:ribosomal protein S3AE